MGRVTVCWRAAKSRPTATPTLAERVTELATAARKANSTSLTTAQLDTIAPCLEAVVAAEVQVSDGVQRCGVSTSASGG
jgi:hypothetical protein